MKQTAALEHDLTPKQQEAVDYKGEHMLIKGIAGSGKTTVLLRRALKIVTEEKGTTVALFTYNATLAAYAKYLADLINPNRVKVYTFHSWAGQVLRALNIRTNTVWNSMQDELFEKALSKAGTGSEHRFFKQERFKTFLKEEISWIKGKNLQQRDAYLKVERIGRTGNVRVTKADREKIFDLLETYQKFLKQENKLDYDDYAPRILDIQAELPDSVKIDHILVDEAQDLQQAQLQVLRIAARKSMIVAADKGQKIYNTSFAWRDIGINIQGGRTKVLQNTFRSTRQIIELAHSLQKNDPIVKAKDEDYIEPLYPDVHGSKPQVIDCGKVQDEERMLVQMVKALRDRSPDRTIGVVTRWWKHVKRMQNLFADADILSEMIQKQEGNVHTPGVKLTTLHSVKGLEFDIVLVVKVREGNIPAVRGDEDEDDEYIAVERRLLYVAMTRAKHELYMLYSGAPSRFIEEMDETLFSKVKL
ncbi:ATP-dependent helicase [Tumebacillus sp. DT12]|uniref:DNA 3'-5' helicase n=1 Tax=Tumebacillus lacus TaxID=2995335 RepID=A0ABT3X7U9_9BACL|nr:ATP-dependent helicase [Tumebacillus lacus]MCX7571731.1 ATP-dependent helicase [Tumebacillus lacus]